MFIFPLFVLTPVTWFCVFPWYSHSAFDDFVCFAFNFQQFTACNAVRSFIVDSIRKKRRWIEKWKEEEKKNICEERWTEIGSKRKEREEEREKLPKIYLNKLNESKSIFFHICALLAITINIFVSLFFVCVLFCSCVHFHSSIGIVESSGFYVSIRSYLWIFFSVCFPFGDNSFMIWPKQDWKSSCW